MNVTSPIRKYILWTNRGSILPVRQEIDGPFDQSMNAWLYKLPVTDLKEKTTNLIEDAYIVNVKEDVTLLLSPNLKVF